MDQFKRCPKCQGNVFADWDYTYGGWYEGCLQCGYRHYLPLVVKTSQKPAKRSRRKLAANKAESD